MNWVVVSNTSWGEEQKLLFGKELGHGYVICEQIGSHLLALASVHQRIKQSRAEVTQNAKIIVNAPKMLDFIENLAKNGNYEAQAFIADFNTKPLILT